MTRFAILRSVLALAAVAFGATQGAASGSTVVAKPPVIHESFTLLPCNQKTTIGMEGCEERLILRADERIDLEVAVIWRLLFDQAARTRFADAESAWLAYRKADCASQADIYEGGTQAGVEEGACFVTDDEARSTDLRGFYGGLTQGRPHPPAFP